MRGITHAVVGATLGIAISQQLNLNPLVAVPSCILGALAVDVDEKHSTINKLFPGGAGIKNAVKVILGGLFIAPLFLLMTSSPGWLGLLYFFNKHNLENLLQFVYIGGIMGSILILSAICSNVELRFSLFRGFEKRVYHRTIFHDPLIGGFILSLPLLVFSQEVSSAVIISYESGLASHYILDSFTEYGLPFYLTRGRIRCPIHFRSGNKLVELTIVLGCMFYITSIKDTILTHFLSIPK